MGMIPGMGSQIRDLDVDDDAFKHIEAIILSMTPEERRNPRILNGSRRKRIARGSGTEVRDVNQLLKQFKQMKKMMGSMSKMMGQGRDVSIEKVMESMGMGGGNPFG
jgi:signal recognition particle subunit SRP54